DVGCLPTERFACTCGAGSRRALRASPTRRSSDLPLGERRERLEAAAVAVRTATGLPAERSADVARWARDAELLLREREESRAAGDRKSTRLNSSHVKISYAGFCLKKKKAKQASAR